MDEDFLLEQDHPDSRDSFKSRFTLLVQRHRLIFLQRILTTLRLWFRVESFSLRRSRFFHTRFVVESVVLVLSPILRNNSPFYLNIGCIFYFTLSCLVLKFWVTKSTHTHTYIHKVVLHFT